MKSSSSSFGDRCKKYEIGQWKHNELLQGLISYMYEEEDAEDMIDHLEAGKVAVLACMYVDNVLPDITEEQGLTKEEVEILQLELHYAYSRGKIIKQEEDYDIICFEDGSGIVKDRRSKQSVYFLDDEMLQDILDQIDDSPL